MQCRVCKEDAAVAIGVVEYYAGYPSTIFECSGCSCRFATHDEQVHNWLHATPSTIYGLYVGLAQTSKSLFDRGDRAGLKRALCTFAKYRFVIDALDHLPPNANVLEIGCSRGYLTSWFILAGHRILGVDVSQEAVSAARENFGDHFVTVGSKAIAERAPFDAIYHVGTIGCVGDPLGMTRHLLSLLRPGGQLLFNAPNADSCWLRGQLWTDSSPPPDLVTLFRPGFWDRQFCCAADVEETIEMQPADRAFSVAVMRLVGRRWKLPTPMRLDSSSGYYERGRTEDSRLWKIVERAATRVARMGRLSSLIRPWPAEFGLFVKMIRKPA